MCEERIESNKKDLEEPCHISLETIANIISRYNERVEEEVENHIKKFRSKLPFKIKMEDE